MEKFPANLDDGELWIPSDIFPADELLHLRRPDAPGRHRLEDLARRFNNSFNLLDHRCRILSSNASSFSQGLEVRGPMRQYALSGSTPNGCYGQKVGPRVDRGHGHIHKASEYHREFYEYYHHQQQQQYEYPIPPAAPCHPPLPYPIHTPHLHHPQPHPQGTEAQMLMETRIASTRRVQQNRHQNRLFPFQATSGFGSSVKDRRGLLNATSGTGVFIPRATSLEPANKKPVAPAPRQQGKKIGTDKSQEYRYHNPQVPSDVRLPQDWTY